MRNYSYSDKVVCLWLKNETIVDKTQTITLIMITLNRSLEEFEEYLGKFKFRWHTTALSQFLWLTSKVITGPYSFPWSFHLIWGRHGYLFFISMLRLLVNVLSDRLEIRLNSFTFSVTYLLCQNAMRLACAYFLKALIDKAWMRELAGLYKNT